MPNRNENLGSVQWGISIGQLAEHPFRAGIAVFLMVAAPSVTIFLAKHAALSQRNSQSPIDGLAGSTSTSRLPKGSYFFYLTVFVFVVLSAKGVRSIQLSW